MRCPVLDTGKNSVKPSTTPKISAFNNNMISIVSILKVEAVSIKND